MALLSADSWVMLASGAGLIAVELARSLPAWLRVKRTGSVAGLSAVSIGVLLGSIPAWFAVAWLAEAWGVMVATAVWAYFHTRLCLEAARVDAAFRSALLGAAGATVAGLALIGIVGQAAGALRMSVGMSLVAVTAAYSLPALWSGMRAPTVTGISILATATSAIEGVIYILVGLGWASSGIIPSFLAFGALAVVTNVPRCWRAIAHRRRESRQARAATVALG